MFTNVRSFLLNKPCGVISSKVDSKVNSLITKKADPRVGECYGGIARPTVYEVAIENGYPGDFGLVGRLDIETSAARKHH
jgi:16S rRNA U516 pseudouridylate synthase RsuA-like enzyme